MSKFPPNPKYHKISLSTLFLLLSILFPIIIPVNSSEETNLIVRSEEEVSSAFREVLKAEKSGANVSQLIEELNKALSLLSEIKANLANGNREEAAKLADNLISMTNNIKAEALTLKNSAQTHHNNIVASSLAISAIGTPIFILTMIIIWRRFKRHYEHKITSKMKS